MRRTLAVFALVLSLGACAPGEGPDTVEMAIRYSKFDPGRLTVAAGTTVRFVVDNRDPIDHELIVGDREVQGRHENGNHAKHGAVPGEVTAPAGTVVETTYTFDEPGTVLFGCHLPGHYGYGMRGTIRVV
jgi:uncharacterized cupredoxin-like copper-binding protein